MSALGKIILGIALFLLAMLISIQYFYSGGSGITFFVIGLYLAGPIFVIAGIVGLLRKRLDRDK
jgi:hypothetical protein